MSDETSSAPEGAVDPIRAAIADVISGGAKEAPHAPEANASDKPAPKDITLSSEAFTKRIADERAATERRLLKELGFDSKDALATNLKVAKQLQDDKLSTEERLKKTIDELRPQAEKAAVYRKQLDDQISDQFNALDENVRAAVDEIADGDPEKRHSLMKALAKNGLIKATGVSTAADGAKAQARPAPRDTSTAKPAPTPSSKPSAWDEFQTLEQTNPILASAFYARNSHAVERSRPADA